MAELSRHQSRFSSFKSFRFPTTSKSNPPPVPPKDSFYINNRSLPAFPPSTPDLPTFPSPSYPPLPSPGPSQSTMSLASSSMSLSPPSVAEVARKPSRQKGFFRFPRRSPHTPSVSSSSPKSSLTSASAEDDGISLPWGFQHHTHVDESLVGLPPSWSASLTDAGYSDAEIAVINARRAATRSPTAQYVYNDRPNSPARGNTIMLHPAPRTTSLARSSPSPPVPTIPYSHSTLGMAHVRTISIESSLQACESPSTVLEISPDADAQYIEVRSNLIKNHTNQSSISSYHSSHFSRSRNSSVASSAADSSRVSNKSISSKSKLISPPTTSNPTTWTTPHKRPFHVPDPSTPVPSPPSTQSFTPQSLTNGKTPNGSISSVSSAHSLVLNGRHTPATSQESRPNPPSDDVAQSQASYLTRKPLSQRLTALPPRLSLSGHNDDLSSWSEAILSAIPESVASGPSSTPSIPASQFAVAQTHVPPPPLSLAESKRPTPSSDVYPSPPDSHAETTGPHATIKRSLSSKSAKSVKSIPPVVIRNYDEDDGVSSVPTTARSPLWDELLGMVQQNSPGLYVPAVNESNSPIIPITPELLGRPFRDDSFIQMDADPNDLARRKKEVAEENEDEDSSLDEELERDPNRDSNTSTASVSTVSTVTVATVVRKASVATRAVANVIRPSPPWAARGQDPPRDMQMVEEEEEEPSSAVELKIPEMTFSGSSASGRSSWSSPQYSPFSSESTSSRSDALPEDEDEEEREFYPEGDPNQVPNTPAYLSFLEPSPVPSKTEFPTDSMLTLKGRPEAIGIILSEEDLTSPQRQMLAANALPTPITSRPRYRGWLSTLVAPLEAFIDDHTDPREHYVDLQEIAEGESGSVYVARVVNGHKLKLSNSLPNRSTVSSLDGKPEYVAIKNVPISPSGSPKLIDLERELTLLKDVHHEHVLGMDALYVDLVEDSLWIRMELMERSLADVVGLVGEGLMIQERMIGRFSSDVLLALRFLQTKQISHRDLRSDNLLLNKEGVLKIADFSNGVRMSPQKPTCSDAAGVLFWQAPEVRTGLPYDPLKVDIWSLGATVWEMSQAVPPFADIQDPRQMGTRLPPLSQPEIWSRAFHDFLRLCSEPASTRPCPGDLLDTPFVRNACGRQVIVQLLAQCTTIEDRINREKQLDDS